MAAHMEGDPPMLLNTIQELTCALTPLSKVGTRAPHVSDRSLS